MKLFIPAFLLLLFASCAMKTYKLGDGITRVAADEKEYRHKALFIPLLLARIDTNAIYLRQDNNGDYSAYRFYGNGCVNRFFLYQATLDSILNKFPYNPSYSGLRGVIYQQNGKMKLDLIGATSGMGAYGVITSELVLKGDTLIEHRKISQWDNVYFRTKVPQKNLNYTANW